MFILGIFDKRSEKGVWVGHTEAQVNSRSCSVTIDLGDLGEWAFDLPH